MKPHFTNNQEGLIKEDDLFFKQKENGRGSSMYKKLILNEKHIYRLKNGGDEYALKETGKWWHEDDFAQKFICPHKHVIHIVSDGDWINETYIPNIGWFKGVDAVNKRKEANR